MFIFRDHQERVKREGEAWEGMEGVGGGGRRKSMNAKTEGRNPSYTNGGNQIERRRKLVRKFVV